jgi:hypothetical protein
MNNGERIGIRGNRLTRGRAGGKVAVPLVDYCNLSTFSGGGATIWNHGWMRSRFR